MPTSVRAELGAARRLLAGAADGPAGLGRARPLARSSTSAGLSRSDTGAAIPGSDGMHIYIIDQGRRRRRALPDDAARALLAGGFGLDHGRRQPAPCWSARSSTAWSAARTAGVRGRPGAGAAVGAGQGERAGRSRIEGAVLDTVARARRCRSSSRRGSTSSRPRNARGWSRRAGESASAFIKTKTEKLVGAHRHVREGRPGRHHPLVRRHTAARHRAAVRRRRLAGCTVGDVLADPERYVGETLADPLEGVDYGRCCAMIMRRADGTPWIHSFAHGRTIYELQLRRRAGPQGDGGGRQGRGGGDLRRALSPLPTSMRSSMRSCGNWPRSSPASACAAINAVLKAAQQQHAAARAKAVSCWQAASRQRPAAADQVATGRRAVVAADGHAQRGDRRGEGFASRRHATSMTTRRRVRKFGYRARTLTSTTPTQKRRRTRKEMTNDQATAARTMGACQDG